MAFLPTVAISRLVNSPKSVLSRRPRPELPDLRRDYWQATRPSGSRSGDERADVRAGEVAGARW